jgi:hypothetical protein
MCYDYYKPKPSIRKPIVKTPLKEAISEDETKDDIGNDVGKPTPSVETLFVATQTKNC